MVQMIFNFLSQIGYTHPVHPALTHIPMGMVMGAFTFRMASFLPRLKSLARTGYHCAVLGLLGIFPTAFAGYLDWQHTFGGQWEFLIILKMTLASILAVTLAVIAFRDDPDNRRFDMRTALYIFSMILAGGIGFAGGQLLYG